MSGETTPTRRRWTIEWRAGVGERPRPHPGTLSTAITGSVEVVPVAEYEALREAAQQALDALGVCHTVVEGPNAGWRESMLNPGDSYYDDDPQPAPDCPVCAAERALREALA